MTGDILSSFITFLSQQYYHFFGIFSLKAIKNRLLAAESISGGFEVSQYLVLSKTCILSIYPKQVSVCSIYHSCKSQHAEMGLHPNVWKLCFFSSTY